MAGHIVSTVRKQNRDERWWSFAFFIQSGTAAQGMASELRGDLPSRVTSVESSSQAFPEVCFLDEPRFCHMAIKVTPRESLGQLLHLLSCLLQEPWLCPVSLGVGNWQNMTNNPFKACV